MAPQWALFIHLQLGMRILKVFLDTKASKGWRAASVREFLEDLMKPLSRIPPKDCDMLGPHQTLQTLMPHV